MFYWEQLRAVEAILKKTFPDCVEDISLIDKQTIHSIIHYMQEMGMSDMLIATRLNSLKILITYLSSNGIMMDTGKDIHFRIRSNNKIAFTLQEITAMFNVLDYNSVRDMCTLAIALLMLDTGARTREICQLDMDHVDLVNRTVYLGPRTFTRGENIPFGKITCKALENYLNSRSMDKDQPGVPFFQERDGRRIQDRTILRNMKKMGEMANIQSVRCTPSTFRNTFAIRFLAGGGSAILLMHILCYRKFKSLNRYLTCESQRTEINDDDKRAYRDALNRIFDHCKINHPT